MVPEALTLVHRLLDNNIGNREGCAYPLSNKCFDSVETQEDKSLAQKYTIQFYHIALYTYTNQGYDLILNSFLFLSITHLIMF